MTETSVVMEDYDSAGSCIRAGILTSSSVYLQSQAGGPVCPKDGLAILLIAVDSWQAILSKEYVLQDCWGKETSSHGLSTQEAGPELPSCRGVLSRTFQDRKASQKLLRKGESGDCLVTCADTKTRTLG